MKSGPVTEIGAMCTMLKRGSHVFSKEEGVEREPVLGQ